MPVPNLLSTSAKFVIASTKFKIASTNLVLPVRNSIFALLNLVFVQKRNQPSAGFGPRKDRTSPVAEGLGYVGPVRHVLLSGGTHFSRPSAPGEFLSFRGTRHFCRGLVLDSPRGKITFLASQKITFCRWESTKCSILSRDPLSEIVVQTFGHFYLSVPWARNEVREVVRNTVRNLTLKRVARRSLYRPLFWLRKEVPEMARSAARSTCNAPDKLPSVK